MISDVFIVGCALVGFFVAGALWDAFFGPSDH